MKVTLILPIEMAGVPYPAGVEVDVDAATKKWMEDNGIIAVKPATAKPDLNKGVDNNG